MTKPIKRYLSFQEASDLLAENPERTDIQGLFTYLGTVHTVRRCNRLSYGWDFLFDTWNVQYEHTPDVVDWLWLQA